MPDNIKQNVVCPSCGKRYQLVDFKGDKLVCYACGREIPMFVTVNTVTDESKYVKQYLDRLFNMQERIIPFIMIPIVELLGFWLLTIHISWWWKLLIVFFMCGIPFMTFKEYKIHWKVRRIFARKLIN